MKSLLMTLTYSWLVYRYIRRTEGARIENVGRATLKRIGIGARTRVKGARRIAKGTGGGVDRLAATMIKTANANVTVVVLGSDPVLGSASIENENAKRLSRMPRRCSTKT